MKKRKFKKFGILPGRPSELIELALADLKKVERSKKYVVDMSNWHRRSGSNICHVCLAGAVMAKELKFDSKISAIPSGPETIPLAALNALRTGDVEGAFSYLELLYTESYKFDRPITDYHQNKSKFYSDMRKLAADLRKAGF